jgi:formylglycine-generating enzyme required for sulfatase activity
MITQIYMKKFITFSTFFYLLVSCSSGDKGELVGVPGKKWNPEKPYGMTLIPGGAYLMGKSDDDLANVMDAPTKTVTVRSFYMDETEITNSEYREFIEWVNNNTCYESWGSESWIYLVDYADYRFDYIDIEGNMVVYRWEELYWGGRSCESREFTFE